MKSRDITKEEINKITLNCQPREQALFAIIKQSGLTPNAIKQLKIKHLEKILEQNTPAPCKISIPQENKKNEFEKHPNFIGEEAIKYLKIYLKKDRKKPSPEDLLFTVRNKPNKEINIRETGRTFSLTAQKVENKKTTIHETKKEKPSKLTLHSLIKFYNENAKTYLTEVKNNPNKNDEFYIKLYEEEAMYNLETEILTPEIHQLKKRIEKIETTKAQYENKIKELENNRTEMDTEFALTLRWLIAPTIEEKTKIINQLQQVLIMYGVTKQELEQRAKKFKEEIEVEIKKTQMEKQP